MSIYCRKLTIGILGIYISYITMSYYTEKLFSEGHNIKSAGPNDPNEIILQPQLFKYPSLVTWIGCLFCSLYGMVYAHYFDKVPNKIPINQRIRLGVLFTLNYLPTNYALLYISYPLQAIAKNARYLLVVIIGVFFSRVKKSKQLTLPRSKIFIAVLISIGAGLFMYFESKKQAKEHNLDPSKRWIGYVCLLIAIICDALFSDSQAYCKSQFKPTPNQLFLASNLYGFMLIFAFSILSGQLVPSIKFCLRYPRVFLDLLLIGILQVLGQISVYYVISNFKQHIYPLISTTRKIFTVLLSIFAFHHSIKNIQWVAIMMVFFTMGFQLYDQVQSQEKHRQIRKNKLVKSYMSELESHISEKSQSHVQNPAIEQSNNANPATKYPRKDSNESAKDVAQSHSQANAKDRPFERQNRFINKQIVDSPKKQEESLSRYRYSWRVDQVADGREISVTPIKKIV